MKRFFDCTCKSKCPFNAMKCRLKALHSCTGLRMSYERNLDETAVLVRALDRLHRRLQVKQKRLSNIKLQKIMKHIIFNIGYLSTRATKFRPGLFSFEPWSSPPGLKVPLRSLITAAQKLLAGEYSRRQKIVGNNFFNTLLFDVIMHLHGFWWNKVTARRPGASSDSDSNLRELNSQLMSNMVDNVRTQVINLQLFIDPELTFAVKSYFRFIFKPLKK